MELAETRSVARALRFAGFGLEFTGAEEVSHAAAEPEREHSANKESGSVFPDGNGGGKPEAKPTGNGNGRATEAQCRALYALTKRAQYTDQDVELLLRPLNASLKKKTEEKANLQKTLASNEASMKFLEDLMDAFDNESVKPKSKKTLHILRPGGRSTPLSTVDN
jgi:hypothetical protein